MGLNFDGGMAAAMASRGVYGSKPNGFSRAVRRVQNRSARGRVATPGDSLFAGAGAGPVGGAAIQPPAAARASSMIQQTAALLAAAGIPTRADALCGPGNISAYSNQLADVATYYAGSDGSSVSYGAGWTFTANAYVYGGMMAQSPVTTAAMGYAPGRPADTFDVYYHDAGAGGTWQVTDASGTLATIVTGTSGTIKKATVQRAIASRAPISLAWVSGGAFFPISIEPYDSGFPMLEIVNMGGSGLTAQGWAGTGNNRVPLVGLPIMAFDVVIYGIGTNDKAAGRTDPQFQTDYDSFVSTMRAKSDVILTKTSRPHGTGTDIASYLPIIDSVAAARGALAVVDFYNGVSLSGTGAGGDYYGVNDVHKTAQGQGKEAALLAQALLALA